MDLKLSPPGELQAGRGVPEVTHQDTDCRLTSQGFPHCRVFYRGCDYNPDTFKKKYDLCYTVRNLLPAWFDDWDASSEAVQRVLEAGAILPLRGYDKEGRFVIIIRQRFADPAVMTTDDLYKAFMMLFSIAMEQNYQV